ncbi:MAG: primosomal protein [Ornithinibacter sp.]|nr:primosomal protein [Ornithinibacter sp.]
MVAAYEDLADAFEAYDGALYDAYGEMTPLDIYTGDDDGTDEDADDEVAEVLDAHDDEDGDDAHLYSGLDDDIEFEDDSSESGDDTDDTEPLRLR